MFGDERGGDTNVKLGFKDMKNRDAQSRYYDEVAKLLNDLNLRFLRARYPSRAPDDIERLLASLLRERQAIDGTSYDEILKMPHRNFFRRRGEPAFQTVSVEGDPIADVEDYIRHLAKVLPQAYLASRDMTQYRDLIRRVAAGEVTREDAAKKSPMMKRKADSVCPCSKGVRWVDTEGGPEKLPQIATGEGSGGAPTFHSP
jgi:hypothetical protein